MDYWIEHERFTIKSNLDGWQLWHNGQFVTGADTSAEIIKMQVELKERNREAAKQAANMFAANGFKRKLKIVPGQQNERKRNKKKIAEQD